MERARSRNSLNQQEGLLMARKHQPLSIRIWHWATAFLILGLLTTVFLRDTFLNSRGNALIVSNLLAKDNISLTTDQSRAIGRAIRDPMWDWHYYLGFTLTGFFILFRVFNRKRSIVPNLKAAFAISPHEGLVKTIYALFYLVTSYMIISGFLMYFSEAIHLSKGAFDTIHEIHEWAQWFFVAFIVLHVSGVVYAENKTDPGIVSDMINGQIKESDQ